MPGKKTRSGVGGCLRGNLLTLLTVTGVILGVVLGFVLREAQDEWTQREVVYVKFVGDLFLRMLKALILPLIVASLVSAIGSLDLNLSGRIGVRAVVYYMLTTVCAVILGIVLVVTIQPGKGGDRNQKLEEQEARNVTTPDTLMDLVRYKSLKINFIVDGMKMNVYNPFVNLQKHVSTQPGPSCH